MATILPSIYSGWNVVLAATIVIALTNGVAISSLPLFDAALEADLGEGWHTAIKIKALLTFAVGGFAALLIGALVDRRGPRSALLLGAGITTVACLAYSRMLLSPASLYAVHCALGFAVASCGPISAAMIVDQWFDRPINSGPKGRGVALAVVLSAPGLGAVIVSPLTSWCLSRLPWQQAAGYLALVPLATFALISLLIPSRSSVPHRLPSVDRAPSASDADLASPSRHFDPVFFALAAAAWLSSLCFFGLTSHSAGLAAVMSRAEEPSSGTLLVALPAVAFGSKLIAGLVTDLGRARAALIGSLMVSAVAVFLPLLGIPLLFRVSLVFVTIAWAVFAISSVAIALDFAVPASKGVLIAVLVAVQVGAGGFGMWLFAEVHRITGHYEPALTVTAVITLAGALMVGRSSRLALLSRSTTL